MNEKELNKYWDKNFKDYPIENWRLRYEFKDRWLRIHALPESKRYPENKLEENIIFSRHKIIINDLMLDEIIITTITYDNEAFYKDIKKDLIKRGLVLMRKMELKGLYPEYYEADDPDINISIYGIMIKLDQKMDLYKYFIDKVNNDEICYRITDKKGDVIIAPYDGGIDIIFPTTKIRDEYKIKYKDWLSYREDGL